MSTNKQAYDAIRDAIMAAMTGFQDAKTAATSDYFIELYRELDDELDVMIAKQLDQSTSQYKSLTQQISKAKERMSAVQDDADKFVRSINIATKIVGVFARVLAVI